MWQIHNFMQKWFEFNFYFFNSILLLLLFLLQKTMPPLFTFEGNVGHKWNPELDPVKFNNKEIEKFTPTADESSKQVIFDF